MGPVNWIAVLAAAVFATLLRALFHRDAARAPTALALAFVLMLLSSAMIGHNFARVGNATLKAKPWLYWMMSGGLALAFVAPALFLSLGQEGVNPIRRLRECGFWIAAYLLMGTVFWGVG